MAEPTIKNFKKILDVFAKHLEDDESPFAEFGHGEILFVLGSSDIPEDSDDGKTLLELGCYVDGKFGDWAYSSE